MRNGDPVVTQRQTFYHERGLRPLLGGIKPHRLGKVSMIDAEPKATVRRC